VSALPTVSVIIPTYNRKRFVLDTLDSLSRQTFPADCFDVIVVDDGSSDGTAEIQKEKLPFRLRYLWQTNQGDAAARNLGVKHSQADILIFLDDDILVEPGYVAHLVQEHEPSPHRIVVGTEYLWLEDGNPLSEPGAPTAPEENHTTVELPFADVCSNNMSLGRNAYYSIGMMEGLGFPGSDIWCDVDFAYRAYLQGFEFLRSTRAICYHRDYVAQNLDNNKRRAEKAAFQAVVLFEKYPDLSPHIPMFRDKTPIAWHRDSPPLMARKLARHVASSRWILASMEQLVRILEQRYPSPALLRPLYRWISGGYMYRGYQAGLREHGPVGRRG
jgi:glycosyltransferase involved in cell wall biosynthesis